MQRILAIEADSTRRQLLTTLVREHVRAELTVVESVQQAISALHECQPDVVLAPMLLAPADEAELMSHIKNLESPHVQTLTMPALDMLAEPRDGTRRRRFSRRRQEDALQYDPRMVAAQIRGGLERARAAREEHEAAVAHARWRAGRYGSDIAVVRVKPAIHAASARSEDERRRARRVSRADVPWLEAVKMPWGLDLDLVNISSTGLLVESTSRLSVGVTYDLQLAGPETTLRTKARFIRSDVGRVDCRGVKYYAAATFERPLDLTSSRPDGSRASGHALTDLVAAVMAGRDEHAEPVDARFARGLRELLRARDVLVRQSPVTPADGSESVYFHVKGEGRSRRILQVLFDPDRILTPSEFKILKAAASLTAAVLELNEPCEKESPVLAESALSVA